MVCSEKKIEIKKLNFAFVCLMSFDFYFFNSKHKLAFYALCLARRLLVKNLWICVKKKIFCHVLKTLFYSLTIRIVNNKLM